MYTHCVVCVAVNTPLILSTYTYYAGYAFGGEGPKVINQHFNVYALRRVRCAGYATDISGNLQIDSPKFTCHFKGEQPWEVS